MGFDQIPDLCQVLGKGSATSHLQIDYLGIMALQLSFGQVSGVLHNHGNVLSVRLGKAVQPHGADTSAGLLVANLLLPA
jgi:hypothetical protein